MSGNKRKAADSTSPGPSTKSARAAIACERCRVKKLRCTGGAPCRSCQAATVECNFELGAEKLDRFVNGGDLRDRMTELEQTVQILTARVNHLDQQRSYERVAQRSAAQGQEPSPLPALGLQEVPATISAATASSVRHDESPSERLWAATQPRMGHVAPFPPLMFHPSVWDNRSRSPSPESRKNGASQRLGRTTFTANISADDDPVALGQIAPQVALSMYTFFFEHCHPLFPIIHASSKDDYTEIRRRSPFLFTAILAVAGRFYRKHVLRYPRMNRPALSPTGASDIMNLAFAHLGASLFWKQHRLEDIQAVQLCSLWVLSFPGQSPDQWLVSGHAARLAYRIGLDKAADSSGTCDPLDRLNRWQAWLAWNCYDGLLSLGLGRPRGLVPSTPANEVAFLHTIALDERISEAELQNARLMASLVQLSSIGRKLTAATSAPITGRGADPEALNLLAELEHDLTSWFAAWLPGINLSPTRQLAELYGNHLRLCISAMALNMTLSTQMGTMLTPYIILGEQAASSIIHEQGPVLIAENGCLNDYASLILSQAAVFLLRLLLVPLPIGLDRTALQSSIQSFCDLLQANDLCEFDMGRLRARTVSDFCRLSNVALQTPPEQEVQEPIDLDWLFGPASQYGAAGNAVPDINQLFGVPFHGGR